ncbi:hypothetical protein RhiirC2_796783 [Rhizophagus irregularis]|uniref:Uncharacterized protein n=1 Tax=Rhizophagus irregularis TaxID=588596 RepID=A0A2N1M945_9GLOM|nr:hypothetical protein RhiirC2_796783 [Rhizophagus irregularis]
MLRDIMKTVDLSLENKPFESKVVIFEEYQYPIEYLNSITIGKLLPHKLKNVIEAEIITGKHAGKHAFLPHVILSPTNATFTFHF